MSYKMRTEEELRAILGEPDEANEIGFVLCYNADKRWFIAGDKDGIQGGYSASDLINGIESGYMNCHGRSYESSMSACVNAIFYKWCIIKIKMSELPEMLESLNLHKSWNISGGATGVKLKEEYDCWFQDPTKHISAQIINEQI